MECFQPPVLKVASFFGAPHCDHDLYSNSSQTKVAQKRQALC
jgi:hypothetical protein